VRDTRDRIPLRLRAGSRRRRRHWFIVDGGEDAVRAVRELPRLDRQVIRARFEERFTAVRMAREYDARYRE